MGSKCPACGADAVVEGICGRCGYASGANHTCPHCGAIARAEPKVEGTTTRWVCAMCGGPRIPGGWGGEDVVAPLKEAKALQKGATRSRIATITLGFVTTFFALLSLASWSMGPRVVLGAMAVGFLALAVRAWARGRGRKKSAAEAMERAHLAAAHNVAAKSKDGVTPAELGRALKIDPTQAEKLLTELAVHDRTRIDVGEDAEVRYSVGPRELSKQRVGTDGHEGGLGPDDDAFTELEVEERAREEATKGRKAT